MSAFDSFIDLVRDQIGDLAKTTLDEAVTAAKADTQAFLDDCKADLKRWTTELKNGDLTEDQFEDLVLGQRDLLKMAALTQAGIGQLRVDRFRKGVIDIVVKAAIGAFL